MPVPKRKTSRVKRDKRRSHDHAKAPALVDCPNCHNPKLTHVVCPHCGFFKGRQIIRPRES